MVVVWSRRLTAVQAPPQQWCGRLLTRLSHHWVSEQERRVQGLCQSTTVVGSSSSLSPLSSTDTGLYVPTQMRRIPPLRRLRVLGP